MFGGDNVGSIEYDARLNTSNLKGDAAQADAIVKGTGDSVERTGEKSFGAFGAWAKVGLLAAGAATVALGVSAFKTGIDYNTLQQTSRAALKTILGSTEAAGQQMDKLNEFVRTSPFSKDIFIRAQQTLLGFGVEAEKVVPTLSAIQDSVAAIGGSSEDIGAITQILAKIKSEGRLGGEALQQLGGYGIDAATIIGSQMGKSGQEIRDMASQPGGIPADQVFDPLVNGLTSKFGGAAANVKNTWSGTADRIGAAFRDLGSQIAAPFVNPDGGGAAIEWGNKFADFLRNIPSIVAPFINTLKEVYTWFSVNILPILQQVATFVGGQLKQAWVDISKALSPFISQGDLIKGILIALLIPIVLVVGAIIAFVVVVSLIVAAIARLVGWIVQGITWFIQFQTAVYKAIAGFVSTVIVGINQVVGAINGFLAPILKFIGDLFTIIFGSILIVVLTVFSAIYNAVSPIFKAIYATISSIITGLFNFWVGIWSSILGFVIGVGRNIYNAISGPIGDVIGVFNGIQGKIMGALSGAANWLYNIGKDIVGGLAKGIKDAIGGAVNAASNLADSVRKAASKALDIHSPSRVFADIGKNIVLGLSQGIDNNAVLASNSIDNMLGASVPSYSPSSSSLDSLDSVNTGRATGGGVTVNLSLSGIMARSKSDERDIAKNLIRTVNEELSAKGVPVIGEGNI